jgi:hypothetical protein
MKTQASVVTALVYSCPERGFDRANRPSGIAGGLEEVVRATLESPQATNPDEARASHIEVETLRQVVDWIRQRLFPSGHFQIPTELVALAPDVIVANANPERSRARLRDLGPHMAMCTAKPISIGLRPSAGIAAIFCRSVSACRRPLHCRLVESEKAYCVTAAIARNAD